MTHRSNALFAALVALLFSAAAPADPPPERLVVFTSPAKTSTVAGTFLERDLPAIRSAAEALGVSLTVVDVTIAGRPAEVTITPLIGYRDARGHSIYQGRTTTVDRVTNFVRTARVLTPSDAPLDRAATPVWRQGGATIAAPIKLTDLSGTRADDFDEAAFDTAARRAIDEGMSRFETTAKVSIERGDRLFYVDFYPHRSGELLYLSTALFSQFHCHEPLYTSMDNPFVGFWDERDGVFAEAAADLETQIIAAMASPVLGDGFDVVDPATPVVSWDELGLHVAARSAATTTGAALDGPLPRNWSASVREEPAVVFSFLPPLDGYSGTGGVLRAEVVLDDGGRLAAATGHFEVETASVSMGEPDLDKTIHGPLMLDAKKHPVSRFEITAVSGETGLGFGRVSNVMLRGTFTMRGRSVPLDVRATFEPVIGEDGGPRLVFTADWQLRLRDAFGIFGPDGPSPANDTLLFRCACELTVAPR